MKFGGTSVAEPEDLKRAAQRIVAARELGNQVVAVLSARKTTDELVDMAFEISERPYEREMDMLLSVGERISCALCAMAIHDMGHAAVSLTGSQAGIVTDSSHTKARILEVRADRIRRRSRRIGSCSSPASRGSRGRAATSRRWGGGLGYDRRRTRGRTGRLGLRDLHRCRGSLHGRPANLPRRVQALDVSFDEMLEMSASGAGVLQLRSVEYARNHGVRIHCRSSFDDGPGTLVVPEDQTMEQPMVTAVTHTSSEARVTVSGVADEPGVAGRIFGTLAAANVNVDMIIQNEPVSGDQKADLSFTVARDELRTATDAIEGLGVGQRVLADERIGKVSIVGAGMKSHPGVAAKVFETLGENGINIEMISTSPIKISCVIGADQVPDAVRALHTAFGLGADAVKPEDPTGVHRPTVAS